MVCNTCSKDIQNRNEMVKCAECESVFHVSCSRIRTASKLKQMSASAVASWRCDSCRQDTASAVSRSDSEDQPVLDILKSIQQDMSKNNKESKESFAELNKLVSNINETLIFVQQRTTTLESNFSDLQEKCSVLCEENKMLVRQVDTLQSNIEDLQQYSRNANIEIKGIPVSAGDYVYFILESEAKALGVTYKRDDVSTAHRLRAPRGVNVPPGIVAQFVSRSARAAWLAAARKRRITTTDLAATLAPGPVYVNEHLTGHNKALLGRAKSFVRSGTLFAAWCNNGMVMVRKTVTSPPRRVRSMQDVETLAGVTGSATATEGQDRPK